MDKLYLLFVALMLPAFACDPHPTAPTPPWAGSWRLIEEGGVVPTTYEGALTLDAATFSSHYSDDLGQDCTWSGSVLATDTEQTWTIDDATGPPCDIALGESSTAIWSLSDDESELTLDWSSEPLGKVQVYARQ